MEQYISKSAVAAEIEKRIKKYATINVDNSSELEALYGAKCKALMEILSFINTLETKEVDLEKEQFSLQQKNPEPYFYCKYGGTMPLCSDCKRNHNNSSFKTEEITTWYSPLNGTKHCIDYIQQEKSEENLKEELKTLDNTLFDLDGVAVQGATHYLTVEDVKDIAKHFFELGLTQKRE